MNPILYGLSVSVSLVVVGLLVFAWKQKKKIAELNKQFQASLVEDLELATSEQLFTELRKRPSHPYILLMPLKSENHQGISVEVHGVPPAMSLLVLKMATMVTTKELQDRGVEIPEFGELPPEFPGDIFNDN